MSKFTYFIQSLKKQLFSQGHKCPACGSIKSEIISRKHIITSLNRCSNCHLQFRVPTTSELENQKFYQKAYKQGFTTDLPTDQDLTEMIKASFKGTSKDYTTYIDILKHFGIKKGAKIFDFGCSWGYGSWQFHNAGFDVDALEISEPRRQFAETKLGVKTVPNIENLKNKYDVFFSAHVLEHVPNPTQIFKQAIKILKPGGLFIAITPNGSEEYKNLHFESWNKLWGYVHPNFLDENYYIKLNQNFKFGSISNGALSNTKSNYELIAYCFI
ncbi:class I SAM-dependent methyltransferase [bacterium]|nr:MAG: class I SAM-dependent methyltransferase [bacterium]